MGTGDDYEGPTLLDFNTVTLQDRGTEELTVLIAGRGSQTSTYDGYFVASGPQKNMPQNTLYLYYMIDSGFRVQSSTPVNSGGTGYCLFTDIYGALMPIIWWPKPGPYSNITVADKEMILGVFQLVTDYTWRGEQEPMTPEEAEDLGDLGEDIADSITEPVEEAQDELSGRENWRDSIITTTVYEEVEIYGATNVYFVQIVETDENNITTGGKDKKSYVVTYGIKDSSGDIVSSESREFDNAGKAGRFAQEKLAEYNSKFNEIQDATLGAERNEEVTTEEIEEEWDKNTKWLLTNDASPITNIIGPDGDFYWRHDNQVLELEDNDIESADSGSIFFKCPENMKIDLRFTTSSNSFNNRFKGIIPDEWVKDQDKQDNEYYFGDDYPSANKVFLIPMTFGDKISIDVDKENSDVTQFRLVVDGDEYVLDDEQDYKIDDEVYINISNPTIKYTLQTTTITDGFGEVIEVKEEKLGSIFDAEGNEKKRDDKDDEREGFQWADVKWGWVIGISVAVVITGLLLYRALRNPTPAVAPPPPVVVVKD